MGVFDLIDRKKVSPGVQAAQAQSTDLFDVVDASFQSTMDNFRVNSEGALFEEIAKQRDAKYKELTGRDIYGDAGAFSEKPGELLPRDPHDKHVQAAVDRLLDQAKKDGRFKEPILNSEGIIKASQDKAQDSLAKQQMVLAGATKNKAIVGSLAGGLGAMAFDPLNVATLPFGAGASRSFLKTIFIEAGINAGAEAASQPFVADWQNQIGNKYGFNDAIENVGMAALFGAAVPTAARGGKLAIRGSVDAFDNIKQTFKTFGKTEAADSAEYMARVAHINESKSPDIILHERAMNEANSALLEGRYINPEKTDVPIPTRTEDPSLKTTVERFNEPDFEKLPDDIIKRIEERGLFVKKQESVNPIFREEKPRPVEIETQEKIEELYSSPESIRAEQELFDDIKNLPDEKIIEFDELGESPKSIADYKREIANDLDFINAIRTCSL